MRGRDTSLLLVILLLSLTIGLAVSCSGGGKDNSGDGDDDADDTWTDPSTGLTWQARPASDLEWDEARSYCENLSLAGGGWRLPNISELRTLIRGCDGTVTGGSCGVVDTVGAPVDTWTDSSSGLTWQVAPPSNEMKTDGRSTYCDELNRYSCLDSSCQNDSCDSCERDVGPNKGCYGPAEMPGECDSYWSSSLIEDLNNHAWGVYFSNGSVDENGRNVRCVRGTASDDGHDDWRLPTISELRSLIRGCDGTEAGGECGVTDDCLGHIECYNEACGGCEPLAGPGSGGAYWPDGISGAIGTYLSSSVDVDNIHGEPPWYVVFGNGVVSYTDIGGAVYARCVRDASFDDDTTDDDTVDDDTWTDDDVDDDADDDLDDDVGDYCAEFRGRRANFPDSNFSLP